MAWLLHFAGTCEREYIVLTDDEIDENNFDGWRRTGYKLESKIKLGGDTGSLPTERELTFGNVEL